MNLRKICLGITSLFFACNAVALPEKSVDCPSVQTIRANAKFTEAVPTILGYIWQLRTDEFIHQGHHWAITFLNLSPRYKGLSLLESGQKAFDTKVTLLDPPKKTQERGMIECNYTTSNDYIVVAFTSSGE